MENRKRISLLKKLIKQEAEGKIAVAKKLMISPRYLNMILHGHKPGKRLDKDIILAASML
jgi:hypothetical protein